MVWLYFLFYLILNCKIIIGWFNRIGKCVIVSLICKEIEWFIECGEDVMYLK